VKKQIASRRGLPDGFSVRPARRNEAGALAALIATGERALGIGQTTFEDDIVMGWSTPGFDLVSDTWVITYGSDRVGYAELVDTRSDEGLESFGVVHPDHLGRGLGSFLVQQIEARACDYAMPSGTSVELNHFIVSGDDRAKQLLETRGYAITRSFWHMVFDLSDRIDQRRLPHGVEIRRFETERDRRAVHSMMEEAFSEHYGYAPTSFTDWWQQVVTRSDFDPTLWLLAWHAGEVIAGVIGGHRGDDAWIHDVGVLPAWRRRGLARSLLSRALDEFCRRGYRRAGLNVDASNESGATQLYRSMGFRIATTFDAYRKRISPARRTAGD
jgi:mycothiol synthase